MPGETLFTAALARVARLPFLLASRQPLTAPRKAIILKPCCVSQAMLTTPLLAALSHAYPQARFDWAISDWARPAVVGNPRLTEIISSGMGGVDAMSWREVSQLVQTIRAEAYDACFIPSRSSVLSLIAWMAGIPQRIGLHVGGRGFADTLAVSPPSGKTNEAVVYLSLATAVGVDAEIVTSVGMEFYPPDADRTAVTRRLVDDVDWLGDRPLVIIHPGGGQNPVRTDERKQWPIERFVLLGNHLARRHGAQIMLVGADSDKPLADKIAGLMSAPVANWAGRTTLGQVGALADVADLYIGHDAGPTHIAAAVGCPTLAIFGPSHPAISAPYATKGRVVSLWHESAWPFSWEDGVTVAEAIAASESLLEK